MKKIITSVMVLATGVVVVLFAAPIGNVTLGWNYPADELSTDLTFRIHGTNDVAASLPWPVLTNVSGLSTSAVVTINPGRFFFYATASNMWGVSDPSNVASTPPLPRSDVNLIIQRAQ